MIDCYNRKINYLRISVTDLCNLRCQYCMPPGGIVQVSHDDVLSFEEIYNITTKAVELGIDKVRLTGGEPLVRKGMISLVRMLADIEGIKDYGMTTNGVLLAEYASQLKDAGLHRLNVSLDALNPDSYRDITRGGDVSMVLKGLRAAHQAGFTKIKINCVIKASSSERNARDLAKFAEENGYEIRYIRRMNMQEGTFWSVEGGDGGKCNICNRIRLSSVGDVYPCLFNDISFSVKEIGIENALKAAILHKPKSGHKSENNQFYSIGG